MKHTREEIITALHIIKDTCSEFGCDLCPFRSIDTSCIIQKELPKDWNINDNDTWRAFK